jgi:hypothetical protein
MRPTWLLLLLFFAGTSLRSFAQQPVFKEARLSAPLAAQASEGLHLSLMPRPSGEPILVVNYPWHEHQRPSIEMRLLDDSQRDASVWKPIFFVGTYLSDQAITAIYRCQNLGANLPATATFSKSTNEQTVDFEVTGQRNSMERSSVTIHCVSKLEGPRSGTRLIFWPLEDWAIDEHTLWLELPKKDFSKPCRLRVWFLRHDDIVWAETLSWPGYP